MGIDEELYKKAMMEQLLKPPSTLDDAMDAVLGIILRNGKINWRVLNDQLKGVVKKENANSYMKCNKKDAVEYLQNNKTVFLIMIKEECMDLQYLTLNLSHIVNGKLCIEEIKQNERKKEPHVQKKFMLIVVEK